MGSEVEEGMEREIRRTEEELTGQQLCVEGGEARGVPLPAAEFSLSSHLSPLVAHQKRLREQHNRQRRLCHVLYKTLTFGLIEHHTDGLVPVLVGWFHTVWQKCCHARGTNWVCSFLDGHLSSSKFSRSSSRDHSSSISLCVFAPPRLGALCVCGCTRVRALVDVCGCVCVCPSVTAQLHDFIAERLAALVRRAGASAAASATGTQNGLGSLGAAAGGGGGMRDSLPVGVVVEPVAKHASLHGYSHADLDLVGTVSDRIACSTAQWGAGQ